MDRPRIRTKRDSRAIERPGIGARPNTGALASAAWLAARGVFPKEPRWSVTFTFKAMLVPAELLIEVYAEEWGFALRFNDRLSWIRVTDLPFVHGADDFHLLSRTARLETIGTLVRGIERDYGLRFDRAAVQVASSFGHEQELAGWARSL